MEQRDAPAWMKPIVESFSKIWQSPGSFTSCLGIVPGTDVYTLLVHPLMREIKGGNRDGQQMYPPFDLSINRVARFFDKEPKIELHATSNEIPNITAVGRISGDKVRLVIMLVPPPCSPVMEMQYNYGPKSGTIEQVILGQENEGISESPQDE